MVLLHVLCGIAYSAKAAAALPLLSPSYLYKVNSAPLFACVNETETIQHLLSH
jgi:hypothetical protein